MTLSVQFHTDVSTLVPFASAWRAWQRNPDVDLDYFLYKHTDPNHDESPFVMTVTEKGILASIVVGSVQLRPMLFQIGYKRWDSPPLRTLVIPQQGILGRSSRDIWAALETSLEGLLISKSIDVLLLSNLDLRSSSHALSFKHIHPLCRDPLRTIQEHWQLTSPHRFEDFTRTHKRLWAGFRNCSNRIRKRSGGDYLLGCYDTIEDLDRILQHTERVAEKSWQRSLGAAPFLAMSVRHRYRFWLSNGRFKAYILYVKGQPVAFLHGLRYGDTFYFTVTGYDPDYRREGVGTFLFLKAIEAHSGREGLRRFDFGVGNSHAKRLLCDSFFCTADRYVVAPTMRLKAMNFLRCFTLSVHLTGKAVLAKRGLFDRVRSAWRNGR